MKTYYMIVDQKTNKTLAHASTGRAASAAKLSSTLPPRLFSSARAAKIALWHWRRHMEPVYDKYGEFIVNYKWSKNTFHEERKMNLAILEVQLQPISRPAVQILEEKG